MADAPALPRTTADLIAKTRVGERHPGLQLDKHLPAVGSQEDQKRSLAEVCRTAGDQDLLAALLDRRKRVLQALSAVEWSCATAGPLTLHLARASALENAGICLHPVYGFVFLPGSGLKGMARAFAETVWLSVQDDPKEARRRIEEVFGWVPSPERQRRIEDPGHPAQRRRKDEADPESAEIAAMGGAVVFHDAWPARWPRLALDIVSNHHRAYYEDREGKDAPGDWEDPIMVSFLAVGHGEAFSFALSKRRPGVPDNLVALAREWLTGALVHLGGGARTAAGYGAFRPVSGEVAALPSAAVRAFETTLELVTPAFLAGAVQAQEDCELRPATLRGLLRRWWRTMHAGFVDVATLRAMEAAVWGDTEAGSPVRVTVERLDDRRAERFAFKQRSQPVPGFRERHGLRSPREAGAGGDRKTSWGLFYHSYGMDEGGRSRFFLPDGAMWRVRMTARRGYYSVGREGLRGPVGSGRVGKQKTLDPGLVLSQARAALWLLSRYGGVGSKGRRGFGSIADVGVEGISGLDDCRRLGRELRAACELGDPVFSAGLAASPALEQAIVLPDVRTRWTDAWFALNEVGYSAQAFAQAHKHENAKKALGLPRNVRPPFRDDPFTPRKGNRHASPVLYHLARVASGTLAVRVVAFPARHLPDLERSTAFLEKLLSHLESDLRERAHRVVVDPHRAGDSSPRSPAVPEAATAVPVVEAMDRPAPIPKPGDHVQAVLLEERTRKGGWKARYAPGEVEGEIQNTKDVPADKKAGEIVTLLVAYARPKAIAFLWPTPEQEARARRSKEGATARPGPGRGDRGRRSR